MKLLLVEDDEDKREQLVLFINKYINCEFDEVRSFQSALKAIKNNVYDLILLDMTMPTFDISPKEGGGRSQPFGGELILYEMVRRGNSTKVVVVTQFDLFGKDDDEITLRDLDFRLKTVFSQNYVGAVQYSVTYTGWQDALLKMIKMLN